MSLSDEERAAIVAYRIEKARTSIADIHKVMPLEVWGIIANRMYYALYYAASALLINDGYKIGTHKGVITLFNLHYVKTGKLSREDGALFGGVFAFRQGNDYDDFIDASRNEIEHFLPSVEILVEKIISLIK